jgi:hypothetical protein
MNWAGPFAEHDSLGPGWNPIVRGDRVVKANPQTDQKCTQAVILTPIQSKVTKAKYTCKSTESTPNVTEVPTQDPETKSRKTTKSKFFANQTQLPSFITPTQPVARWKDLDILDILYLDACVELTCKIFAFVPTLHFCQLNRELFSKPLPLSSRVGQHWIQGQRRLKACGWPAETVTVSAAGMWNLIISSVNTGSTGSLDRGATQVRRSLSDSICLSPN